MSSAAASISKLTRPITKILTDPIEKGLEIIGISDERTRASISGFIGGGAGGGFLGASEGRKRVDRERGIARQAESEEADRKRSNDEIFSLAQSLSGGIAGLDPDFDFESFVFKGSEGRSGQLGQLVNLFQRRQTEIEQRRLEPGNSQTRLSLLG